MLTIGKMHGESVAYYESTVDTFAVESGPDGYYSEDGRRPATAWVVGTDSRLEASVSAFLGVESGDVVDGKQVAKWFNSAQAPSGKTLGRRPGRSGVPGFDLTFCAPKSVSLVWGFGDAGMKKIVDEAHAQAVSAALSYLSEHAGYTRKASEHDPNEMILARVSGLSGVKYEHKTSRAGDPHVHSHVLLSNRQLCPDGKSRTLDSKSVYHEARAAGMLYQSVLRSTLSKKLGVSWAEVSNGCAEIAGLDDLEIIEAYSTRMREINDWKHENGADFAGASRMGQAITRRVKDTETPMEELHARWMAHSVGMKVYDTVASFAQKSAAESFPGEVTLPSPAAVINAVIEERSTFTRADLVEKTAELMPVGIAPEAIVGQVEALVDQIIATELAWSVNPDMARSHSLKAREGSQRFTAEAVVEEVNDGIDLATARVNRGVDASSIRPMKDTLSVDQARAMRAVVASCYRASVVVAPAGAGKTSSLKAARQAWERAGKTVVGLAPTGKAADVMVREDVAHTSATIAKALVGTREMTPEQIAFKLGWDASTVVVVDEAGMVATPDMVTLLQVTAAADARIVFVGDPHQYAAVKARSGMLATLAYELPDAVELTEVFRQKHAGERLASQLLRNGDETDTVRAAQWYADHGRLHAGSSTAMLMDALTAWARDKDKGLESLLVASTREDVDLLNRLAQQVCGDTGAINPLGHQVRLSSGHQGFVGDVILTKRNNYDLLTDAGDIVRNGQRWIIQDVHEDGSMTARRMDDTHAIAHLPVDYVKDHVQLGYASTGHAAQGATVDTCHVVAGLGQVDRAGVYVPLTRGRYENHLYLMDTRAGDPDTGHGSLLVEERRETPEYARDLLINAAKRDRADITPQQLWRDARADFELAKLSSNLVVDQDPYAGTHMATVMAQRQSMRRARLEEFYQATREQRAAKKKQPAQVLTAEEIVEASLKDRPLADIPGWLLEQMVDAPHTVVETYQATEQTYHVLVDKAQQAEAAKQHFPVVVATLEDLQAKKYQVEQEFMAARAELETERSKPGLVKLVRGGKLKDAQAQVDDLREQLVHATREVETASTQLRDYQDMIATAPTAEQVGEQENKLAHYRRAVEALDNPAAVATEDQWRSHATWEVLRADTKRRDPQEQPGMREVLRAAGGDKDLSTMLNTPHTSTPTSVPPAVQRPSGLERDRGYGL